MRSLQRCVLTLTILLMTACAQSRDKAELAQISHTENVVGNGLIYNEQDQQLNKEAPPSGILQRPVVGVRTVLVSVVNWQGENSLDKTAIEKLIFSTELRSLRSYIQAASGGKLLLTGQAISFTSRPRPEECKQHSPSSNPYWLSVAEGEKAAKANGLNPANFDYLINLIDCRGGASAFISGRAMGVYGATLGSHVYLHEFGHVLGYAHGFTFVRCSKTGESISAPEGCGQIQYGDTGDTVSGGSALYPAANRWYSGWLEPKQVATINRSGLYRLGVLGKGGPQLYVVDLSTDSRTRTFWAMEYRQPTLYDDFASTDNRITGLWLRYHQWIYYSSYMINTQLDATPETAITTDPTLQPGQILVDHSAKLRIKTCSRDPKGLTMVVAVNDEPLPSCTPVLSPPTFTALAPNGVVGHRPTVGGTGFPGSTVAIHYARDGYLMNRLGTAIVSADGYWSTQLDHPLPTGSFKLYAYSTNPGSTDSIRIYSQTINVIETPSQIVIQSPPANSTTATYPVFTGTGLPGAQVYLERVRDGYLVGVIATALVDENGKWAAQSTYGFTGSYRVAGYQNNGSFRSPSNGVNYNAPAAP